MAGLKAGVYDSIDSLKKLNAEKKICNPSENELITKKGYAGWKAVINSSI